MLLYTCLASTASNLKHIISDHFYMQTMETYFYLGLSRILIGPSHDSCREKSVVFPSSQHAGITIVEFFFVQLAVCCITSSLTRH